MMIKKYCFALALCFLVKIGMAQEMGSQSRVLDVSKFRTIGKVEERYQSFNVEMCEIVGGDFWIPYHLIDRDKVQKEGLAALKHKIDPIDLYQDKLRMLAAGLGPTYVRVSGTWANTVYFQDDDNPKLTEAPAGFETVLTRKEWKGVIDFVKAVDGKLITSFAISDGIRDEGGNWTPAQLGSLLDYTKSIGGEIAGAEMFNEPSHASHGGAPEHYSAADYARDFAAFKKFVDQAAPDMKILGPGSTGEGGIIRIDESMATDLILSASPAPAFDIFTYHFYGGVSQRCRGGLTPENALSADWLSRTELGLKYYKEARDQFLPDAPIWLTETAEAACGGDPWAATYLDTFRYLEQLGRLAKKGVQVVMHNTLAVSEYALLDQYTLDPRPNYWAAFLWNKLMGAQVYEADFSVDGVDVFVHNLKGSSKGFAVLLVNPQELASTFSIPSNSEMYLLTADELQSKSIRLNGEVLNLTSAGKLPLVKGEPIAPGEVVIPAHSMMFLAIEE
jgi:heparanase